MSSLLERDANVNNLLDVIDELKERIEILERNAVTDPINQVDVQSYTIASGEITLTGYASTQHAIVDTEGAAATDDLDTINPGTFPVGGMLWIKTRGAARDVTLTDGTGNLRLEGDMTLDTTQDTIVLGYIGGSVWLELSRSNNAT